MKLAAAASGLKRASGGISAPFSLAFLTDRRRIADPEPILRALPAGTAVIYRDYDDPRRAAIAARYRSICRRRGISFIIGEDAALAKAVSADGLHLPARRLARPPCGWSGLVAVACHDARELQLAASIGADVAFLSPVFATASHPDTEHIGPDKFRALASDASLPVIALGGVNERNARLLAGKNVAGLAAIGAFAAQG